MRTIITTTGISLYFNTKRKHSAAPTEEQMRDYLHAEPQAASAEANSLLQFAQLDDNLVFLHTETVEAHRCATLLEAFFHHKGFKHIRIVALQFQEDEKHIETHGLRNLVDTLIDEVEKAQRKQQEVVINATAGFKAQIVYSTMIGMLYHIPVMYMYEHFHRVVTFDPIPLDWDTNLFFSYDSFFHWIDDDEARPRHEVETRLKAIPERERVEAFLTSPDVEGNIYLSPIGEALRKRFKQETEEAEQADWPPVADIEKDADKIGASIRDVKHHFPDDTLTTCEKIAQLPWVVAVIGGNFENTTFSRLKGFNEDGTIRLLWADNDKATNLTVQTTAQGRPQTRKVAEKIRELLEIA